MVTISGKFIFNNIVTGIITDIDMDIKIKGDLHDTAPMQIVVNELLTGAYDNYGILFEARILKVEVDGDDIDKAVHVIKNCITKPYAY